MKYKKIYIVAAIVLILVGSISYFNNRLTEEEEKVMYFYPEADDIEMVENILEDAFIAENFPALKRGYEIDGQLKAFVTSCVGYNGPVKVLTAFSLEDDSIIGIEILNHEESPDYGGPIESDWFIERFKEMMSNKYLKLVDLEKENPEDIIQVTGATVSSQAVVNSVNAAIGTYQYINNNVEMAQVADIVSQEMWDKDINSLAINWEDNTLRINTEEIKEYQQLEVETILLNTTGTENQITAKGPTLRHILETEGLDLGDFEGIGITGRDGYYTMVDKGKVHENDVILAWEFNGEPLKEEEKPVRIVIPNELGPYWVKMVSHIDLYGEISTKDIEKVHMFDAIIGGIEPYYYEYYGSKDKSIEVGKILRKFDEVDEKGLFTMGSSDGFIKNETISLVRQRYYIKIEGEGAPMNIAPDFKRGMNVKDMTHFSTTKDAVIFPDTMEKLVRIEDIVGQEGLLLEDVLLVAGMRWNDDTKFAAINIKGEHITDLDVDLIINGFITNKEGKVTLFDKNENKIIDDLLRIEKK